MMELTSGVNWLAVGIGTVLSFILGSMWFSPLMFGEKWAAGVGAPTGKDAKPPFVAMSLQLIGTFLFAWLVAIAAANDAWPMAVLLAATLSVLLGASDLFGGSSRYAAAAEAAFPITMFLVMALCQLLL